jgi:hypothetical protein
MIRFTGIFGNLDEMPLKCADMQENTLKIVQNTLKNAQIEDESFQWDTFYR